MRPSSPSGAPAPAVEVRELTKRYGPRVALDGVSFDVAAGEVLGLLGPNGAGKTTTVEILEGYRRPDGGAVRVLGTDPRRGGRALRERIGVMLQEGGVHPGIRALEALRLFASYYRTPADPEHLLAEVGLGEDARTPYRRLSGGRQRRLALALALVGRPELVFLDEPTAGMDPRARAGAWETVEELRDQGTTVVLTTHSMEEAEQLADRLVIVDRGRIVASGTPEAIMADAAAGETRFTATAGLDVASLAAALGLPAAAVREARPGDYRVAAAPSAELVAALTAWLRDEGVVLGDLHAGRRSLEEVFLRLTEGPS